jgi:hypothetical protein
LIGRDHRLIDPTGYQSLVGKARRIKPAGFLFEATVWLLLARRRARKGFSFSGGKNFAAGRASSS